MKECPECKRTYSDETLAFCLADGTLLSPPFDPQATERIPSSPSSTPTEVMSSDVPPPTKPAVDLQSTMPFNPNLMGRQYAPANSDQPRKSNALLWLIAVIGVAILGLLIYFVAGRDNSSNSSSDNSVRSNSSGSSPTPSPSTSVVTTTTTPAITPSSTVSGNTSGQRITQPNSNTASSSNQDEQARAEEKVQSILRRSAGGCKISKILSVSAERTAYGWKVTARVVMSASGSPLTETAVWNISERNGVVAASQLSAEIEHGCG